LRVARLGDPPNQEASVDKAEQQDIIHISCFPFLAKDRVLVLSRKRHGPSDTRRRATTRSDACLGGWGVEIDLVVGAGCPPNHHLRNQGERRPGSR